MSKTKLSFNAVFHFQTLHGKSLEISANEIHWQEEPPSCILFGTIQPIQWSQIWAEELFQLSLEVVVHDVEEFEKTELITLELALDKKVLQSLLIHENPIEKLLEELSGQYESSIFLQSTSWKACSVMQEIGVPGDPDATLQIGFQTIWAENRFNDD